jgi:uncharacterized protein with predicted RNA binding PUA domain
MVKEVKKSEDGELFPAFPQDVEAIRRMVDSYYGDGCGDLLFPDDRTVVLNRRMSGDVEFIANGAVLGRVVSKDGNIKANLTMPGLRIVLDKVTKHYVRCDHDSAYFVKRHRDLMAGGVLDVDDDILVGEYICILDKSKVIACGIAKCSLKDLSDPKKPVVKIKDTVCDSYSHSGSFKKWDETVAVNRSAMAPMLTNLMRDLKSRIMYPSMPTAVLLDGSICSEAALIMAHDTGAKVAIMPVTFAPRESGDDDFIGFLSGRLDITIDDRSSIVANRGKDWNIWSDVLFKGFVPNKYLAISGNTAAPKGVQEVGILLEKDDHKVCAPLVGWSSMAVWIYVMSSGCPFNPEYFKGFLWTLESS